MVVGMRNNRAMPIDSTLSAAETSSLRTARRAFFTTGSITRYCADWARHDRQNQVTEPSAGDSAFLVAAVRRREELSDSPEVRYHETPE